MLHYLLKSRLDVTCFSTDILFPPPESHPGFHIAFIIVWLFILLGFMTVFSLSLFSWLWWFWRSLVFCRKSLCLTLSDAFSWLLWGYGFLRDYHRGEHPHHCISGGTCSQPATPGACNLDLLGKMRSLWRFLFLFQWIRSQSLSPAHTQGVEK